MKATIETVSREALSAAFDKLEGLELGKEPPDRANSMKLVLSALIAAEKVKKKYRSEIFIDLEHIVSAAIWARLVGSLDADDVDPSSKAGDMLMGVVAAFIAIEHASSLDGLINDADIYGARQAELVLSLLQKGGSA